MKIIKLKKIIIFNIALFLTLSVGLGAIIYYVININLNVQNEINNNKRQIRKFQSENSKRKKHHEALKKFSKNWSQIPTKSKVIDQINPSIFNDIVNKVSEKYYIKNITLSLNLPQKIRSGSFNKEHIEVNLISGNITYSCSDDVRSLSFLHELFGSIPGDFVITSLTVVKAYEYSNDDFLSISKKGASEKIRTKAVFEWYYKNKK